MEVMMGENKRSLGTTGESIAVDFLLRRGYRVLERQFRSRHGEIDIIAAKRDTLFFIEVKTRRTFSHGEPLESVPRRKRQRLMQTALWYLEQADMDDVRAQFAVIGINLKEGGEPEIEMVENAFDLDGLPGE